MEFCPVWLPAAKYPDFQLAACNTNRIQPTIGKHYAVAQFKKTYKLEKKAARLRLNIIADAFFYCFVNGHFVGLGPVSAGGDFPALEPVEWAFENSYEIPLDSDTCEFDFTVRLQPEALTEFSQGHGCLWLKGFFIFEDGSERPFGTEESWLCRQDTRYKDKTTYDALAIPDDWTKAEQTEYACRIEHADIPHLVFEPVKPLPGTYIFDRIYSGYIRLLADKPCTVNVRIFELPGQINSELTVTLDGKNGYTSLSMYSVGGMEIDAPSDVKLDASIWYAHYPIGETGAFDTSEKGFDRVMDVCRHTLQMCRQTIHIDSPSHQELLACTGDYYVMMLMTLFETGDMRLADADVRRTAMWLIQNRGRMFHTTYSLIWVQMLRKLYEFTGNLDTVKYCIPAMRILLSLFESYIGENGIIDNPPDYMFVDWTVMEGYSMHHPPKALGQSVLNCFYYKALTDAAYLESITGGDGAPLLEAAKKLKDNVNRCLWDGEKQLYIDGLDTYESEDKPWRPENPNGLRHFSRYPQALASLYGLCDEKYTAHLAEAAADETNGLQLVQPYYMHFVLEAVINAGLTDKYAFKLLRKWIPMCENCPKGLQEGWIKPQDDYSFDHSHAWVGTPAYHLPMLLTGLKILEPGLKKISLDPKLYGLEYAYISLPTPEGFVTVVQKSGTKPQIIAPKGIEIIC